MRGKVLEVSAIENGTVIDHIPSENLFKVMGLLHLDKVTNRITFGNNLESKRIGKKAIIKISDMVVDKDKLNYIAAFAPEACVSYIKDYEVSDKIKLQLPDTIEGSIKCANPMCITNAEKIKTRFTVVSKLDVAVRCQYCEKITWQNEFQILQD